MLAKGLEGITKVVMRRSVVGLDLHGFGVAGDSFLMLAEIIKGEAHVIMRLDIVRLDLQGFGVAGYCRLQPPRGSVHCAQDIRDQRLIGILLGQSVSLIQSLLKPAPAVERNQIVDLLLGRRIIVSGLFLASLCHLVDFWPSIGRLFSGNLFSTAWYNCIA
jgi:hypothetical protein